MPNNLYSRQIRYVSITVSLFLGFNVALGLNLSYGRGLSSSLKTHISRSSLPYFSNSDFNIVLSILLAAGSSLSPLNKWDISDLQRCLLEKLLTNTFQPFSFGCCYITDITTSMFFFRTRSNLSTTNYLTPFLLRLANVTIANSC